MHMTRRGAAHVVLTYGLLHRPVQLPAHWSDLLRFKVMYDEGGIYMDTDHVTPPRCFNGTQACTPARHLQRHTHQALSSPTASCERVRFVHRSGAPRWRAFSVERLFALSMRCAASDALLRR
jgi:hypothetical protein